MDLKKNSHLCRLCLYRCEPLIDIFDENGKHGYIAAEVIEDLLHFNVNREDGYPQQVCARCLSKLTDFKSFKLQCYGARLAFDKEIRAQGISSQSCPPVSAGRVEVKVEKVDAEDEIYDVDTTGGITAEVLIKTEIDCDESFTRGILGPEAMGDGLAPRNHGGVAGGAFPGVNVGGLGVRDLWGTMGAGLPGMGPGMYQPNSSYPQAPMPIQGRLPDGGALGSIEGSSGQPSQRQEEFVCPQCGKSFAFLCYMNKHIRTTHNRELVERKHECVVCKMRFAKRGNLERHSMIHNGERTFVCERCGKAFFHNSELQAHASSHIKLSAYSCDYCQRGFGDKLHLIEHISRHTNQKPFSCTICGKAFGSVKNLKLHEKIHEPNPMFKCEQCNKTFSNRIYFLNHQRKHTGELFGCLECGKTFVHKYSLKQHEALHREDGGFACDACGKKFDKKNHLRVHTMLHTGERPYECKYCPKRFHVASHLKVHLKLHTGERSFYCNFCGKGFVQKSHYVDHVRVHTGERPFACTECNRAFCQRQQLRQHMKTHSKDHHDGRGRGRKKAG
ncbi:gastrula zinc finger protein XlCGF57.1-like isoform X2 [Ischnura elegans]|uniref:gastrula zinc finger protein XlCGF57.1-like isoform X2 n=1 Tax=Ischnura elegans TaxID=197161 RepID=UPI001ED8938C|nr:gastrula zinc finger protein XlCGF57.1-like isoform X2 [Ischnura elegans]